MPRLQLVGDILYHFDDAGAATPFYPATPNNWVAGSSGSTPVDPETPPPVSNKRFIAPFDMRRYWDGGDVGPADEADYGPRSGRVHQGQDFGYGKARGGAPVIAAGAGRITFHTNSGFGYYAVIDHGDSIFTVYGHMPYDSNKVPNGSQIQQGQQLGVVGNTGGSFGAHLHWETHVGGLRWSNPGTHMNPRDFLEKYGK